MTPKVNYTAHIYQAGTRTLPSEVCVSQEFDLAISVRDLRPRGTYNYRGLAKPLLRGVFAAYCDVIYDPSRARVMGLPDSPTAEEFFSSFTFSAHYQNGEMAFEGADRINELGAFATTFTGLGVAAFEVVRVQMQAIKSGPLTFTPDVTKLPHPQCDTLVFGNLAASPTEESYVISPQEIYLVGVSVNVREKV